MTPPTVPAKSPVHSTSPLGSGVDSSSPNQRDDRPMASQEGLVQSKERGSEGVMEQKQREHGHGRVSHLSQTHSTHHRDDDDDHHHHHHHHPSHTFPPLPPAKHTSPPSGATIHPTSSPAHTAAPAHMPQAVEIKIERNATEARLSRRLVLALKRKPTLTRTWEKKTFTAELRTAPLGDSIRGANVEDLAGTPSSRPTSLYASPAALRTFRPLPHTAPASPSQPTS